MRALTHPTLLAALVNLAIVAAIGLALWLTRDPICLGALLLLQNPPVFAPSQDDDEDEDDDPEIGFTAKL